jgi:hypothetical protein
MSFDEENIAQNISKVKNLIPKYSSWKNTLQFQQEEDHLHPGGRFHQIFSPIKKLPAHINFAVQFDQQLKLQILSLNWCTFC